MQGTFVTATELLSHLTESEVTVQAENGQLTVTGRKGTVTPEVRSELVKHKPELLALLAGSAEAVPRQEPALRRVPKNGALPLSFAKMRLWFLNQYEPENPFYNIPLCLHLRGFLNIPVLERSLKSKGWPLPAHFKRLSSTWRRSPRSVIPKRSSD